MINNKRKLVILLLLIFSLLLGCQPADISTDQPTFTSTSEIDPTKTEIPPETITKTPTPTVTPLPLNGQQTRYFINATIDYYNRFITAESNAVYTNKTSVPIDEIMFVVYPTIFQNAIYIKSVEFGDGSTISDFYWESHRMVIPLESPLLPGETVEITHEFELYMPDRGGVFSHSGKQLNLSYWFPFIPPYDETDGWVAHEIQLVNSSFIGEFLVFEAADFDISLQFTDRRENFKIAAPVLPKEEDGIIQYDIDLIRTFTLSISDQFEVFERQVDDTIIQSFAFSEHASVGDVTADIAVEAFTLYSEIYGLYDRELLTIVEFNSDIGMEFDGLIFLSPYFYNLYPGTPQSNIHVYTAHEIAHQWFFSIVGNDQALEPWLDEAFATYSERLFYETYYPDHLSWYQENYIDFHNPSGKIDVSIYFGGGLGEYRDIVYRNGACFLRDLHETIGDEAFYSFLKAYVKENRHEIATADDFWRILKQNTDTDLAPLIEEYFTSAP